MPKTASPGHLAPGTYSVESEMHLLDRFAVLYRYRTIMAAVFVLTTLAVMLQGYTAIPLYQAQAQLLIEDERTTAMPGIATDTSYAQDPEPYYQTQYKILKGRDLIRRVVEKLNLKDVAEFNGTSAPAKTPLTAIRDLANRTLIVAGLRQAPRPAEPPRPDEDADESAMVDTIASRVQVEPVRGSRLVNITFVAMDPKFAAVAINTLATEYVDQNLAVKQQATQNMLDWLEREKRAQQDKVEANDRALAEYRDKQNALSLDDKQNIVLSRLNQLNDAATKAKTARVQRESIYQQVASLPAGASPDSLPVIAQNATIQSLRSQLSVLQRQKAQLSERYGDKHPEIQKVNAQLSDTQRQIQAET